MGLAARGDQSEEAQESAGGPRAGGGTSVRGRRTLCVACTGRSAGVAAAARVAGTTGGGAAPCRHSGQCDKEPAP